MQRGGICFGSHTLSHRPLTGLSRPALLDELTRSRDVIEALLGQPITTLAYPYNKQNRQIRAVARQAGYRAAVLDRGRINARWTNPQALMRIAIDFETTFEEFETRLRHPRFVIGF